MSIGEISSFRPLTCEKGFAPHLSTLVHTSIPPAVTYPQILHQAIDCIAFGTRNAQANCFNHVRSFRGTTLRTSRRFFFHDAPSLSLGWRNIAIRLIALGLGQLSPGHHQLTSLS